MKRIILFAVIGLAVLVAIADAGPCQAQGDICWVAERRGTCVYENNSLTCRVSDGDRKKREAKQAKKKVTKRR